MGDRLDDIYNKIYNKYIYNISKRELKYYIIISVFTLIGTNGDSWTEVNDIYNTFVNYIKDV